MPNNFPVGRSLDPNELIMRDVIQVESVVPKFNEIVIKMHPRTFWEFKRAIWEEYEVYRHPEISSINEFHGIPIMEDHTMPEGAAFLIRSAMQTRYASGQHMEITNRQEYVFEDIKPECPFDFIKEFDKWFEYHVLVHADGLSKLEAARKMLGVKPWREHIYGFMQFIDQADRSQYGQPFNYLSTVY